MFNGGNLLGGILVAFIQTDMLLLHLTRSRRKPFVPLHDIRKRDKPRAVTFGSLSEHQYVRLRVFVQLPTGAIPIIRGLEF